MTTQGSLSASPHWTSFFSHLDETFVLLLDGTGVVTYASPSVARWLGYEPDELVGNPIGMLGHPEEADALPEALARGTVTVPAVAALRLRRADGGWRTLELTVVSLRRDALSGGVLVAGRELT